MENSSHTTEIIAKAAGSAKWAALTEIISRTANPIITVILARFLTPEDFGIVATAMVVISFGQMLWDAGLSKALIQTEEKVEEAAHVVFWTNLVFGVVIYLALYLSAPWVAMFFKSPTSANVLQVLGFQLIIASLTSVQTTLFTRDMQFRRLMWVKLFTSFIPGFFSIPMAMLGHGVWALVAGTLVGQIVNLILLWSHSNWRPAFRYNFQLARKLAKFGFWILAEAIGGWLQVWGDSLIVGSFLGVKELGVYRLGWTLTSIIYQLILSPMQRIMYPAFSRLQNDRAAVLGVFRKANRLSLAITIPVGVGLLLVGPEIAATLFGEKWAGLGFVIGVIGLMLAVGQMTGLNPEVYRALGHPRANAVLVYVQLCYYLPAYYFAAQQGLIIFVYVRLIVCVIALPMHVYLCRRILGTAWNYLWVDGRGPFLAAAAMSGVLLVIKMFFSNVIPQVGPISVLLSIVPLGIAIYFGLLALLDKKLIQSTIGLLKQASAS